MPPNATCGNPGGDISSLIGRSGSRLLRWRARDCSANFAPPSRHHLFLACCCSSMPTPSAKSTQRSGGTGPGENRGLSAGAFLSTLASASVARLISGKAMARPTQASARSGSSAKARSWARESASSYRPVDAVESWPAAEPGRGKIGLQRQRPVASGKDSGSAEFAEGVAAPQPSFSEIGLQRQRPVIERQEIRRGALILSSSCRDRARNFGKVEASAPARGRERQELRRSARARRKRCRDQARRWQGRVSKRQRPVISGNRFVVAPAFVEKIAATKPKHPRGRASMRCAVCRRRDSSWRPAS